MKLEGRCYCGAVRYVAEGDFGKREMLRRRSLCQRKFPVALPVDAKTTASASEVELSLADSVRKFETGQRDRGSDERFESFQWLTPRFDPTMILLDNIVEILEDRGCRHRGSMTGRNY